MVEVKHALQAPQSPNGNQTNANPGDKFSDYWIWQKGQMSGPYSVEELRGLVLPDHGGKLRNLGKILITDLARSHAMKEWVTVDRVLATALGDNTSDYWVSRNGQMSGPYSLEQLRGWVLGYVTETLRQLGRILISDLTKNIAMPEWVTVDRVLATMFGDNTSDYWVSRNGQMSGPYSLDALADWVRNGRILVSDLTKNIAMPEWATVDHVLDQRGFLLPPQVRGR